MYIWIITWIKIRHLATQIWTIQEFAKLDSNVQGNESRICNGQLKSKVVSEDTINVSKWNLDIDEICLLSKGLGFIPTGNNENQKLKHFSRMLRLKYYFRNDHINTHINPFKTKSTFNPMNKETAME